MKYLELIANWNESEWIIVLIFLGVVTSIWSVVLITFHIIQTRRLLRKQKERYEKYLRPIILGEKNETSKEQYRLNDKEDW